MPLKKKAKIQSRESAKISSPLSKVGKPSKAAKPAKASGSAPSSWLTTGAENIRREIKHAQAVAQKSRVPEFWLNDGETKLVRFASSAPIGRFMQHSVKVNGKFRSFTVPGLDPETGEMVPDLFARAGYKPINRVLYEIIDRTGFTNKEGKRIKDVSRFWAVGMRLYESIEKLAQKYGDLRQLDIEVSRSGTGTSTTYTLLPEPKSPFDFSKVDLLADKVAEYYSPPTLEEQKAVLAVIGKTEDDEDVPY